jgi:hypothetical protein
MRGSVAGSVGASGSGGNTPVHRLEGARRQASLEEAIRFLNKLSAKQSDDDPMRVGLHPGLFAALPAEVFSQRGGRCVACRSAVEAEQVALHLPCGHLVHHECGRAWFVRSKRCPVPNCSEVESEAVIDALRARDASAQLEVFGDLSSALRSVLGAESDTVALVEFDGLRAAEGGSLEAQGGSAEVAVHGSSLSGQAAIERAVHGFYQGSLVVRSPLKPPPPSRSHSFLPAALRRRSAAAAAPHECPGGEAEAETEAEEPLLLLTPRRGKEPPVPPHEPKGPSSLELQSGPLSLLTIPPPPPPPAKTPSRVKAPRRRLASRRLTDPSAEPGATSDGRTVTPTTHEPRPAATPAKTPAFKGVPAGAAAAPSPEVRRRLLAGASRLRRRLTDPYDSPGLQQQHQQHGEKDKHELDAAARQGGPQDDASGSPGMPGTPGTPGATLARLLGRLVFNECEPTTSTTAMPTTTTPPPLPKRTGHSLQRRRFSAETAAPPPGDRPASVGRSGLDTTLVRRESSRLVRRHSATPDAPATCSSRLPVPPQETVAAPARAEPAAVSQQEPVSNLVWLHSRPGSTATSPATSPAASPRAISAKKQPSALTRLKQRLSRMLHGKPTPTDPHNAAQFERVFCFTIKSGSLFRQSAFQSAVKMSPGAGELAEAHVLYQ